VFAVVTSLILEQLISFVVSYKFFLLLWRDESAIRKGRYRSLQGSMARAGL
jgi:hypothetical protein